MSNLLEIFPENETAIERKISDNFTVREQVIYMNNGGKFPERTTVSLEDGQVPYKAGKYNLSPNSFTSDKYSKFCLTRFPKLIPVK